MLGETIALLFPDCDVIDPMGEPVIKWRPLEVDGALVRPKTSDESGAGDRVGAIRSLYSIALPKSFTRDMPSLANARVALVDRGMDPDDGHSALRIFGSPDRTMPCPTKWDVVFDAGRVDG